MGAPILVLVKCWKLLKCSLASAVLPERCNARASANSAEACSGSISSALLQNRNGLVELLQLLVADALEISGVRIPGIDLHRLLKAGQRRLQFVARVLGEAQVVPCLRAVRLQREGLLAAPSWPRPVFAAPSAQCPH